MSKEVSTPIRTIRIGSSPEADLVLADESIDPSHAELAEFADHVLFLADLGSECGTYILRNGTYERHNQGEVKQEDLLRFGEIQFSVAEILSAVSQPVASTPPSKVRAKVRLPRIPSWSAIWRHPRFVLGSLAVLTGLSWWSYNSEWETYDAIESQLELARGRIQDRNADRSSKESVRGLLTEAQDRAIVASCFWSCSMKISLAEEGARLEALLGENTARTREGTPPS